MINVTVTGNVGQDPELKDAGESQVLSFSIASNDKVKGKKVTTWVRCSIWGKRAEGLEPHIRQGDCVTVVGPLSISEYENKDGETKTSIDVRVDQFAFGGSKSESGDVSDDEFPHGANEPKEKTKAGKSNGKNDRGDKRAHSSARA